MPEIQLLYFSIATRPLTTGELIRLTERSEAKNSRQDITGVLLYGNGCFMQCLEGDIKAVELLYHRICGDPRHMHIMRLSRKEISERLLGDWNMCLVNLDDEPTANLNQNKIERLFEFFADVGLKPDEDYHNRALDLIARFRQTMHAA